LGAEDQAAIGPLVKLLEGLPLPIELAAARVRLMSPRTLLTRMDDRFKLLASTGGRRDRQATLRAVFDWSWDLLSLPEKAALAQFSVFEGGFTLEAAEAVLDLGDYDAAAWPIDVLQSLVQKSLVRQVADDRFDLLVSVQEYAAEHLRTPGRYAGSGSEAVLAAQTRHGAYFAHVNPRVASVELDNLIAGCRRAAASGDAVTAAKTLQGAWVGLALRGPFRVGIELASLVHAIPGLDAANGAIVHWVAGSALRFLGKVADARTRLEISLEQARESNERACETQALLGLGSLDIHAGRAESARHVLELALAAARELGDFALQSEARNKLGNLEISLGKHDDALPHFEAALRLAKDAGDRRREASALGNLGTVEVSGAKKARFYGESALAVARDGGDHMIEGNALCNLGLLDHLEGRFEEAREHLEMALVVAREIGNAEGEGVVLCNLGMVHDAAADLDEAETKYEAALAIARESGNRRLEGQILGYLGVLCAHRGKFDEARNCFDAGDALLRAVSDQISLGILLCNRGEVEQLAGSPTAARTALSAVEKIAADVSAGADSELGLALRRLRQSTA